MCLKHHTYTKREVSGALANSRKATLSFRYVRPSVLLEQLGSQWKDFDEI